MNIVLYLRSSKDRTDIAIDTQRRELTGYALAKEWTIVDEFADSQISGSLDEESRPGYAALIADVRNPRRGWDIVLALDGSRIARDIELEQRFRRTCERCGVVVHVAHGANGSTSTDAMHRGLDSLVAKYHADVSREKGRKGLEQNFLQGYRNGGRAPYGYRLEHSPKGTAMRDGKPVLKSKLVPDPKFAPRVQAFLRHRAAGITRAKSAAAANLPLPTTTLLSIERNAITYTGHSVWNVRRKLRRSVEDKRKTMLPNDRDLWKISDQPTHEALITRQQADAILAELDTRKQKRGGVEGKPTRPNRFALAGLLVTPDGKTWQGDGAYYRIGKTGPRVRRVDIEMSVLDAVRTEIEGKPFAAQLIADARKQAAAMQVDVEASANALRSIERKIANAVESIVEMGLSAALRAKLAKLETERDGLRAAIDDAEHRNAAAAALEPQTRAYVAQLEFFMSTPGADVASLRDTLAPLVERITLDEQATEIVVSYQVRLSAADTRLGLNWRPQRDSNPRTYRERVVS